MPTGFSELDLLNLSPDTRKPPAGSRMTSVKAADQVYRALRIADERSAINRARVQALFDGAAPYDSAFLRSTGQQSRTNLNFGVAGKYLDIAIAGYIDLINAVETFVNVECNYGQEGERDYYQTVIAEEVTRSIRDWPEFHSNYLRLITQFIIHGVGIALFRDTRDFRFRVTGMGDFLIPRGTRATEHAVEVAVYRDDFMLHELYAFIKDEDAAKAKGWNPEAVKDAMLKATTVQPTGNRLSEWEKLQAELKQSDISSGTRANTVPVCHTYVREFDGSVSYFVHCENAPADEFMFKEHFRYENPEQAYVFFLNGVGTQGTFHSVRGLGQRIFQHAHVHNRLNSHSVDAAMLAGSIIIQPESQRAMDELSLAYYGPYAVLSPNVKITEKVVPNLSNTVVPVIDSVAAQMEESLGFYSTRGAAAGSPYRTKLQVEAELESATRLTGAQLNLFYNSWRRLLREIVRRIVTGDKTDPTVREFHRRVTERGVPAEALRAIDFAATTAVKAIGAGNASARTAALNDLQEVMPMLDESGRKNLIFDRVAARVGYDAARRYATPSDEQRPSYDAKQARLENSIMSLGGNAEVSDSDLHETHLNEHAPVLQEILSGIDTGQIDPIEIFPTHRAVHEHVAMHVQYLSGDPSAQSAAAAGRELVANSGMMLTNTMRAQQKLAREQAGQPTDAPDSPETRMQMLKLEELQLRIQQQQQKFEQEERRKESAFQQKLALSDITARNGLMRAGQ
jgi:hypothetical protein